MPKISVIIPVYNTEKYLKRCLDSVISQTLKDIEIICVNDGSTDDSLNILEKYSKKDERIKIISKKNGGLSSARNAGLDIASGDYIGFVDSDDWIEPDTYQTALENMQEKQVDLVCWGANVIAEKDYSNDSEISSLKKYHQTKISGIHPARSISFSKYTVTVWNKLFKNNVIKTNNIRFPKGLYFEDNEFFTKYILFCKDVYFIDKNFYNYLRNENTILNKVAKSQNITLDYIDVYINIYNFYKKHRALKDNEKFLNEVLDTIFDMSCNSNNKAELNRRLKKLYKAVNNNILENKKLSAIHENQKFKLKNVVKQIFSVENEYYRQSKHKVITAFGLKMKFKVKK